MQFYLSSCARFAQICTYYFLSLWLWFMMVCLFLGGATTVSQPTEMFDDLLLESNFQRDFFATCLC